MSPSSKKSGQRDLHIATTGIRKYMYFNRYQIEWCDNVVILYFGLVNTNLFTADLYSCAIIRQHVIENRDRLLQYLGRVRAEPENVGGWSAPMSSVRNVDSINIINACNFGDNAEIVLVSFPFAMNMHPSKDADGAEVPAINGEPLAVLRSSAGIQKQFLMQLLDNIP